MEALPTHEQQLQDGKVEHNWANCRCCDLVQIVLPRCHEFGVSDREGPFEDAASCSGRNHWIHAESAHSLSCPGWYKSHKAKDAGHEGGDCGLILGHVEESQVIKAPICHINIHFNLSFGKSFVALYYTLCTPGGTQQACSRTGGRFACGKLGNIPGAPRFSVGLCPEQYAVPIALCCSCAAALYAGDQVVDLLT